MLKNTSPHEVDPKEKTVTASSDKIAPSVRVPILPPNHEKHREPALRQTHRQRMKAYFTGRKPIS